MKLKWMALILILFPVTANAIDCDTDTVNDAMDISCGGTDAATASAARTNLGLEIGADVQEYDSVLDDITTNGGVSADEINANAVEESHLKAVDAAADEECLTYETTTGDFEWQACGSGSGDVTEAGDNDFSGTNTHSGTETFTGTVNLPSSITLPSESVDSGNYVDGSIDAEHIASYTLSPIVIAEPDQVQDITDAVPLYHFLAETYPSGVTITSIHISTSATNTDDMNFEEWSNNGTAWSTDATVEAITLSGTHTEDDGTLADADIAADAWLYVDLDDAMSNIEYLSITISFTSQ